MQITLETLPQAFAMFVDDTNEKFRLLLEKSAHTQTKSCQWFDINQLCDYLPHHPAKATIYGLVHRGEIPNMKQGKKLIFSKDAIDTWLESHRRKTKAELQEETTSTADSFLVSKKKKGGING